ncbi:MAG: phosphoglycerate dehydrogenase [Deltaproteobacteria bacterium]|nr:phosphoglycerate dehydrogenase [Deltaproteobacteria bacterium]
MKVLVADKLAQEGLDILKTVKNLKVDIHTGLSQAELEKIIDQYDIVAVRSGTTLTAPLIEKAKNLKLIVRAGIGVDNIDVPAATQKGVIVENTPGGNVITTAEHTIALLFSMARRIPEANLSLRQGKWERSTFVGLELTGKNIGVIGLGNIGRIVALRALGLKMNVLGYDPYLPKEAAKQMEIKLVSFEELLSQSDFITVHVPLTEQTKNLISKNEIKKMKNGVCIINCARGGIINERDLLEALQNKKVWAAALDVFEEEPPQNNPLITTPHVVCTPHLGASTADAQINVSIDCAKQIIEFVTKNVILNSVNVPSVSRELLDILDPYLLLTEKLGKLMQQMCPSLKTLTLEYAGEIVKHDLRPLTSSFLMGFFSGILGKSVNFVNASTIAQERGLDIIESKTKIAHDFASLISVKSQSNGEIHTLSGTIFGKTEPRIVNIDGFYLEAVPEGYILFVRNFDRPNVIGNLGNILGKNKINISRMHLGLDKKKGEAISLINIDTLAPPEILKRIENLPDIISVKQVLL